MKLLNNGREHIYIFMFLRTLKHAVAFACGFTAKSKGRFLNADKHTDSCAGVNGTNMFAYCSNNPVMFIDPTGESIAIPVAGSAVIVALYAITVTGIVMVALNASGITVSFGEVLSGAISLLAEQTRMKVNSIKVLAQALVASLTISAAEKELENIADRYNIGDCDKAAKAMKDYLTKKGLHGSVITLNFKRDTDGIVYSESYGVTVGNNYFHMGVEFNGIVYCVVHKSGLSYINWWKDFIDKKLRRGTPIVINF